MMKKVYVCAPLEGNIEENIEKARQYARYALMRGATPVVPHFFAWCLDIGNASEKSIGIAAGLSLLWFCDELWVFGNLITDGMQQAINFCLNLNVKVCYIKEIQITG